MKNPLKSLLNRITGIKPESKFEVVYHNVPDQFRPEVDWIIHNGGVPGPEQIWLDMHVGDEKIDEAFAYSCLIGLFHRLPNDPKDVTYLWVYTLDRNNPEVDKLLSGKFTEADHKLTRDLVRVMMPEIINHFSDNKRALNTLFLR